MNDYFIGILIVLSILAPTIFWIIFTSYQFHKSKGCESRKPNLVVVNLLRFGFVLSIILIAANLAAALGASLLPVGIYNKLVPIAWSFSLVWIFSGWIIGLASVLCLKDKGVKYRKWIIAYWILGCIVFIAAFLNPIPQSV